MYVMLVGYGANTTISVNNSFFGEDFDALGSICIQIHIAFKRPHTGAFIVFAGLLFVFVSLLFLLIIYLVTDIKSGYSTAQESPSLVTVDTHSSQRHHACVSDYY